MVEVFERARGTGLVVSSVERTLATVFEIHRADFMFVEHGI
jgi:hypothetical protein